LKNARIATAAQKENRTKKIDSIIYGFISDGVCGFQQA
jgi:hypothetical protein